jgi:hypothetical protein
MADHANQQILEAVQAVLIAASTAAGSTVYLDRVDEIPAASLPAIDILGGDDTGEDLVDAISVHFPAVFQHDYGFTVRAVCAQASGAAKAARNLAKQVEAALLAGASTVSIGGKTIEMIYAGSTETKDGDAAVSMFAVSQSWRANYRTRGGTPDTPI